MKLELTVRQAKGLKHTGKHCVEFHLDGAGRVRTAWIEDQYNADGYRLEPKSFRATGTHSIGLRKAREAYEGAYLHITVVHQRFIRDDKCVGEAHIHWAELSKGISSWVALEHKDKSGGQLLLDVALTGAPASAPPAPAARVAAAAAPQLLQGDREDGTMNLAALGLSEQEVEAQRAILASLETARESPRERARQPTMQPAAGPPSAATLRPAPAATLPAKTASWAAERPTAAAVVAPSWPEDGGPKGAPASSPLWPDWPVAGPAAAALSWPVAAAPPQALAGAPRPASPRGLPACPAAARPAEQPASTQLALALPPPAKENGSAWLPWLDFRAAHGDRPAPSPQASAVPVASVAAPPVAWRTGRAPPEVRRHRALLIGVDYASTSAALSASASDAAAVRDLLLRLGFPQEWILCLSDSQSDPALLPTRSNILCAMRWLVHEALPGDAFFFYFAGHSSQREDENAPVKGSLDDAIVPMDLPTSGVVTSNQAFELMVQNLPDGVRLTALVDTFHPCILLDLPFVYDGEDSWNEDANPFHVVGDVVCWGAEPGLRMSPGEKAALQHAPRGPLTTAFLQSLLELGARRRQEYGSPKETVFDREGCVTVDPAAFGPRYSGRPPHQVPPKKKILRLRGLEGETFAFGGSQRRGRGGQRN
ncbi:unnamed protein product [Prorocentrum cordatum]|uniref:Peptidase C14 caspase domain-containing protein n=1 Tax=Prorocentrum cordatum TaxID=2364126 RepID=A0ABN9PPN6_9DINO|nr:unnamed protein product [Polarella glacialis]